jgi:hypothetical protein
MDAGLVAVPFHCQDINRAHYRSSHGAVVIYLRHVYLWQVSPIYLWAGLSLMQSVKKGTPDFGTGGDGAQKTD